ncbi:B12-binding domain-containing radical SAM protein, partial [Candidatus Bathyarchaeota archaeon]|nr:B12-binding domain-containing radical SAM protein [Candidatus Bathyarchaeota archaeon]
MDCDVFDMNFSSWSDFQIMLRKRKPDVVGFSVTTPIAERGFKAAKMVREILPDSKIVFCGPHATVDPIGTKEHADIVVMGEGEITMFNILKGIEAGNNVNGMILGETVKNLDDLPFPDRKLVDMEKYPSHSLMVSRGCPYNCLYCQPTQRKLFGNKVKFRSVSNVMNEIDWIISEFGRSKEFFFLDDTFIIDKDWMFDFCKEIRKRKIGWMCITRVNMVDDKLLSAMASAGCVRIFYGVESGSQRILNFVRKGITINQTKNAFKLTHKNGILANAFLMVGTPTETKEDLKLTAKLIGEIH